MFLLRILQCLRWEAGHAISAKANETDANSGFRHHFIGQPKSLCGDGINASTGEEPLFGPHASWS